MIDILRQNNTDLQREMVRLKEALLGALETIPEELNPYFTWVVDYCDALHQQVTQNLADLDLGQDAILPDILSVTQTVTRSFRLLNQRLVSPVLRARPSDRLCLKLLSWLHATNPSTAPIPVALNDEEFGILPIKPTLYFMPCSAQQGLLYLPLFIHEYGHLLYSCHHQEMDDLTRDFQSALTQLLEPGISRDDLHAQGEEMGRINIVETWYQWIQEMFCDAVGFWVGGPAFLHAFSMYLRMHGPDEFHVLPEDLVNRTHPVTFLRVRILAHRVRAMGFDADGDRLEWDWEELAQALGIVEDYYGFYEDSFLPEIQQTLDDMLTETDPRRFSEAEIAAPQPSPISLLNQAWKQFQNDLETYPTWEDEKIRDFLNRDLPA